MDVLDLARGLCVEVNKLLTSWCSGGLLVIRSQSRKEGASLLANTIRLVNALGLLSGIILAVETIQGGEEAARYSMLLV